MLTKTEPSMKKFHGYLAHSNIVCLCELLHLINYTPPKGCVKFKFHKFLDPDDDFEENFNSLPFVNKPMVLPHEKKSPNEKLFYTQEMANIVLEKRKIDFEFFGYDTKIPEKLKKPK